MVAQGTDDIDERITGNSRLSPTGYDPNQQGFSLLSMKYSLEMMPIHPRLENPVSLPLFFATVLRDIEQCFV